MNGDIAKRSLALLKDEQSLFDRCMSFQTDAIRSALKQAPITDDGLRAATAIACYTYDMLLCGWNSLIHGFYSVAFHSIRSIKQAMITEIAVTLDTKTAKEFWDNILKDGEASKKVQVALANKDPDFSKEWGDRNRKLRNNLTKYQHINSVAISLSIIIANDLQSASPTFGGFFSNDQCMRIGRLYANLAFDAAINSSYALRNLISLDTDLENELNETIEFGKPLMNSWVKEMGFS
ncbi:MAG: hypothetical protein U9N44_08425 [Chloroflexota bacterium]|nr:hypothetical protein [Chloroflexota bacterium]